MTLRLSTTLLGLLGCCVSPILWAQQIKPIMSRVLCVTGKAEYAMDHARSSNNGSPPKVEWCPLRKGTKLPAGATIRTGSDAYADFNIVGDRSVFRIQANTQVMLSRLDQVDRQKGRDSDVELSLASGSIVAAASPPSKDSRFEVTSNGVLGGVHALPTHFAVTASLETNGAWHSQFGVSKGLIVSASAFRWGGPRR